MEKEMQKLTEENNLIKIRIGQVEVNDSMRYQGSVKQNLKNEKKEENVKYLIGKTTNLGNRSRRETLRIIGLPESHDERKEPGQYHPRNHQGKPPRSARSRGHHSLPERDPKLKTPRNIIAKLQNYQMKDKILQAARRNNSNIEEIQSGSHRTLQLLH